MAVHENAKVWHGVVGITSSSKGGFGVYGASTIGGAGVAGESEKSVAPQQ